MRVALTTATIASSATEPRKSLDERLVVRMTVERVDARQIGELDHRAAQQHRAVVTSTVMPGQFATRADAPVSRLKNVDLPVFGAPTSAIRFTPAAGQR